MWRNKTFSQTQVFSFFSPETQECGATTPVPTGAGCGATPWGTPAQRVPCTSRFPPGHQDHKPTTLWGHRTVSLAWPPALRPRITQSHARETGSQPGRSSTLALTEGSCPEVAVRAQSFHLTHAEPRPGLTGQEPSSEHPCVGQGARLWSGSPWGRGHTQPTHTPTEGAMPRCPLHPSPRGSGRAGPTLIRAGLSGGRGGGSLCPCGFPRAGAVPARSSHNQTSPVHEKSRHAPQPPVLAAGGWGTCTAGGCLVSQFHEPQLQRPPRTNFRGCTCRSSVSRASEVLSQQGRALVDRAVSGKAGVRALGVVNPARTPLACHLQTGGGRLGRGGRGTERFNTCWFPGDPPTSREAEVRREARPREGPLNGSLHQLTGAVRSKRKHRDPKVWRCLPHR